MSKANDPSTQNEAARKNVTESSKDTKIKKKVGFQGERESIESQRSKGGIVIDQDEIKFDQNPD